MACYDSHMTEPDESAAEASEAETEAAEANEETSTEANSE